MSFLTDQITQLKQKADNFIGQALGFAQVSNTRSAASVPWNNSASRFWAPMNIDPARWNQLFPYRLVVVNAATGAIVGGSSGNPSVKITTIEKDNTIINFEPMGRQWVFRLPITPGQLNITDQFAINTTATLRGIAEEHGGLKFKTIVASGTMGVWPYRSSVTSPPSSPNVIQSVFGGALEQFNTVVEQVRRVINTATSGHPANPLKTIQPAQADAGETSTGYYHALALEQFLEQYAEAKKNPANAAWRLVFDVPKQNQSFVVTPLQFVWNQSETKPDQIMYTFQLKAWRRIDLAEKVSAIQPTVQKITPGILQRILSTINEARKLTSASTDLIGAVRSDIEKPLDVLRQSALLVKDLAGVAVTAADLPFQIQKDYASSIKDSLNILSTSLASTSSDPSLRSALTGIKSSSANVEGLSLSAVGGGQLGKASATAQSIDPSDNVFRSPEKNFSLMDAVPVFSMSLNNAQQAAVDQIIENSRQITVDDIRGFRTVIQDLSLQLSNNFGAGDAYYSQIYNRPPPVTRLTPMTLDEYELLKALYDVMQSYDILTATTDIDDANKQTNMEYVAGLADEAGIDFDIPTSKILAPVPFGLSIEQIASRYLGDAQRWLEIVTLNNLRDPYIDETGFQRSLLSNATGRQITISSVEDMFIGQRIVLRSSSQSPSARRILGIDRLSDTSFLLSLDGEANLDNFTLADQAYIQAYLPGTVNSQQKIFIPSELPVPNDPNIIVPTSVQSDTLVGLSKVDWLLTEKGDLATNSFGDFRFAAGITNIIQCVKLKLSTPKGKVLLHPEYGLGLTPGMMNSDVNVQDIFNSINKLIEEDPRFQGLDSLQINLRGPTLSISMGVQLAGQSGVFPLTFELAA